MKTGILSNFSRFHTVRLFLGVLFLWSLLPLQSASGSSDLSRMEQREFFVQGQGCPLSAVIEFRGKHSADQQINGLSRTPQDAFEAFERTITADRATITRSITPPPVHIIFTQHTSSEL